MLKNAIDYLWRSVSSPTAPPVGPRAVEHLRLVSGELQTADVRQQVVLSLITEFESLSVFKPGDSTVPR